MDWLWQLFDNFEKSIVFSFLLHLNPLDWFVLFAFLWGMAYGSRKGFSGMFGKVLEILLISLLVMRFYVPFASLISNTIPGIPGKIAEPMAFFLLGVFSWLIAAWFFNLIGKFFHMEVSGVLKPLGGIVLGLVYCTILISFVMQLLIVMNITSFKKTVDSGTTYSGSFLVQVVPQINQLLGGVSKKPAAHKAVKVYKSR